MPHLTTRSGVFLTSLISLILISLGAACEQTTAPIPPAATPEVTLIPYATRTPISPTATMTPLPAIPVTPAPTATPFLHVIKKDDSMLGLAIQYGVKLEDLLAANPEVNPHFMTIGKTVVIPLPSSQETPEPTATPVPLQLGQPTCYLAVDSSAWCFVPATNEGTLTIENASAWVGLYSSQGELIANQAAIPPLNLIHPGETLPLLAFFSAHVPAEFHVRAEQLTGIEASLESDRYLPAEPGIDQVTIDPGGLSASAKGRVNIDGASSAARLLWIVLTGYDREGNAVAVRKWDSTADQACQPPTIATTPSLTPTASPTPASWSLPDSCLSYDLKLYSLGPAIQKVDVQVEARP